MAISSTAIFADEKPADIPNKATPSKTPAIVCLHTEYTPYDQHEALNYRLMRELGRQALLIAARDELGLATRDQTLGEVFPDSVTQAKQDLFISVRSQYDGAVRFQIWPASKTEEILDAEKEKKHDARAILNQVEKLEPRIHGELRDQLRSLGFDGKAAAPNEKNVPPDSVDAQLLEMNYVSQFAAVRAAHAAMAEKGQSPAWLGVLARGYANLSLLTEHHWKSDTEVFAARALLYAQRLAAANPNDQVALAQRAYVWAVVGLHGAALDELKHIDELRKQHPDQPPLPSWYELIAPYCSFEREPVMSAGDRRPSLRQLAPRLSFEQHRAFWDDRWLFDSARRTLAACPEDYSVYAALTSGNAPLSVGRTGAYYAPAALAHFLPARIAKLDGVPTAVREAAIGVPKKETDKKTDDSKQADEKQDEKNDQPPPAAESTGEYAAATIPIVEALRAATRSGDDKGEPSWSALGEIIFEEQFVQAANFLHIAMNATESSHDEEVKSMLPAIKGHRYAPHIQSYSSTKDGKPAGFNDIVGDMLVVDPRGNMKPMIDRLWRHDHSRGSQRGVEASRLSVFDRGLTYNSMMEAYNAYGDYWWNSIGDEAQKLWSDDFHVLSLNSPQALQFEMGLVEKPTYEQLTQWESEAGETPSIYRRLGYYYSGLERYEDAIRVYERSIQLSPDKDAFVGMAYAYRASGQENMWQPTLERFFKVESLGLEHATVHSMIANDLIDKGKLEEARPHAVAAGETYSAWGLLLASQVEERLGHWEDSEKWIRAASSSYPSSIGAEWYFWCRRTGRGRLDEARKLALSSINPEAVKNDAAGALNVITYHLLENDMKAASADIKSIVKLAADTHVADEDMVRAHVQAAIIASELKESDASQTAIKEARRLTDQFREKYPHLGSIYTAICDVLEGKPPAADALPGIEKEMEGEPGQVRVNCQYFLGRAYDLAGNKDQAEKYWKECVTRGPYDRYPATLAGKYLSDRHKTSRP